MRLRRGKGNREEGGPTPSLVSSTVSTTGCYLLKAPPRSSKHLLGRLPCARHSAQGGWIQIQTARLWLSSGSLTRP